MKEGQGDTASHFRQQFSQLEFCARYSVCSLEQDFQKGCQDIYVPAWSVCVGDEEQVICNDS